MVFLKAHPNQEEVFSEKQNNMSLENVKFIILMNMETSESGKLFC